MRISPKRRVASVITWWNAGASRLDDRSRIDRNALLLDRGV